MLWLTQSNPAGLSKMLKEAQKPHICLPVLTIDYKPITLQKISSDTAIAITSRAALIVLGNFLPSPLAQYSLYCVGQETATVAKQMGFVDITLAETVEALMPKLPDKALIYYRGLHINHPITHSNLTEQIVYEAKPLTELPADFPESSITQVVLCSARGAKIVAAFTLPALQSIYCLSNNIAESFHAHSSSLHFQRGHVKTVVATQPSIRALSQCLI